MADINESIEQLTASLQELAAHTYTHTSDSETVAAKVPSNKLHVSQEVESFVEETRAYSDKTRNVSVGSY